MNETELLIERRALGSQQVNRLTIYGMIITVVLSIGGTWTTNIVSTNVNDTKIETLMLENQKDKEVNKIVYRLEGEMASMKSTQDILRSDFKLMDNEMDSVKIHAAKQTQATENLVDATKDLTETVNTLVIEVTKLSSRNEE